MEPSKKVVIIWSIMLACEEIKENSLLFEKVVG